MGISENLDIVRRIIRQAEIASNRLPESVLLLAVSKQQGIEAIRDAHALGVSDFGENYFQEAQEKIIALEDLPLNWHFIGPIQSNKTKGIATLFNWVHSINREKIAVLLNEHRPSHMQPLNLCLQVNLIEEDTKAGVSPEQVIELAKAVSLLPRVKLRGLMTIPPPLHNQEQQYAVFLQLHQLMHTINQQLGLNMDTLSMGMSDDLIPAISAGATIVRIGRALFGERIRKTE